jgi:PKD repeat protein
MTAPTTAIAPATRTAVTGIVVTPPADARAGVPAVFTFSVNGMPLVDLTFGWGDQTMTDVGAVTQGMVSHVYTSAGAYTLTVTAKASSGASEIAGSGPFLVK